MSSPDQMPAKVDTAVSDPALKGLVIPPVAPKPEVAPDLKEQLGEAQVDAKQPSHAFAPFVHGYLWSSVSLAEQKAAFVFAVDSVLLAYLFKIGLLLTLVKNFPHWAIHDYLGALTALLSCASVVVIVTVVMPRLGGASKGLVYFGSIASRRRASEYADEVIACSDASLDREVLEHCHELAAIAKRKFLGVKIAMWLGLLGFSVSLAFLGS